MAAHCMTYHSRQHVLSGRGLGRRLSQKGGLPVVPPSFLAFGLDSEGFFHPGRARNSHRRSLSGAAAAGILCFLVAFDMKLKKGGVE